MIPPVSAFLASALPIRSILSHTRAAESGSKRANRHCLLRRQTATQPTTLLKTTFYFSYCIIFIDGIEDIENLYDLYFLDILEAIDFPDIIGRALGGRKRAGEIVACSP